MIERSHRKGTAEIRMAHEPANVLTVEFSDALAEEIGATREDDSVRAVVLTGTGSAFSAGVDLFRVVDEGSRYVEALLVQSRGAVLEPARLPEAARRGGERPCDRRRGRHRVRVRLSRHVGRSPGRIGLPELRVGVPFPSVALGDRAEPPCSPAVSAGGPASRPHSTVRRPRPLRGFVDEIVPPERTSSSGRGRLRGN